jgi:Protein of unknown function (DUF3096)
VQPLSPCICRAWIEYRDLGKVLAHEGPLPHPSRSDRTRSTLQSEEFDVSITVAHITPLISLLAGVLILVVPALLNYIVAIYLIIAGVVGLNEIHHFLN